MKKTIFGTLLFLVLLSACKTTKFVPDDRYLLDNVAIKTSTKDIVPGDLKSYLRQTPNTELFGIWKLQLGVYNLSGRDTTKWINRAFRKMGSPPVIYDSLLTYASIKQLRQSVQNLGYFNAQVDHALHTKDKKAKVTYTVDAGEPYRLDRYSIDLPYARLRSIVADTARSLVKPNMRFDVNVLDAERARVVKAMKNNGYYYFEKDFLHYTADSIANTKRINLEMGLKSKLQEGGDSILDFVLQRYTIRRVVFHTNYNMADPMLNQKIDTVSIGNYLMSYSDKRLLRPGTLISNCFILPNGTYNEAAVERTYAALNGLPPVNFVNISFRHVGDDQLDCFVVITPNKAKSFSVEGEGTYSGGDWGIAASLGYTHRNLFKGAEVLSLQGRVAHEWRTTTGNAFEAGADAKLKFPSLLIPFIKREQRRLINANTELSATYQYQKRPAEYTRTILGVGIKYAWAPRHVSLWHGLDLFELSYVQLPWMSPEFENYLHNNSSILRYQYEDHLIMRLGYSGTHSNYNRHRPMRNHHTIRYNVETAGNLLYGIDKLSKKEPDENGIYRLLNVPYAQYAKADFDLVYHQIFNENHRIVYHGAIGTGYPYGNAQSLPFEKRYYAGGSNSVRGWTVRTLGPGTYQRTGSQFDFNNQTGDIKLDLSMEYRTKLFWLLDGALFVDAGNIWTIQNYDNQPGGLFAFDSFYKELGLSCGAGIRFDFSFFILRFDLAMKLHDPGQPLGERWRTSPTWKEDFAFHFAIGYPF